MSSSVVGGIAFLTRKNKLLCALMILLVLLVGFSRLWLGVHTPQDVVCGLLTGLVLILALNPLINWAEKDKNRYLYLLGLINILAVLALIYIRYFNSYRMDYISGEHLVDPQKLIYVTFVVYAYALGLINGCFLCRKFCSFDPKEASLKQRVIRGVVGSILLIILLKCLLLYIFMNVVAFRIAMPVMFILGLFITLIYPVIFTKLKY